VSTRKPIVNVAGQLEQLQSGDALPVRQFEFVLAGILDSLSVPYSNMANEIATADCVISVFQGRRGVAGTAGTTRIDLYKNGVLVSGATLSWPYTDSDYTLHTASFTPVSVSAGDRLSITLVTVETGVEDVFAEAH
jgi:hypothetical protein